MPRAISINAHTAAIATACQKGSGPLLNFVVRGQLATVVAVWQDRREGDDHERT
jgi:hypothetical protein